MTKRIGFLLLTFAFAIALGASNYNLSLSKPAVVNGQELRAGDYKIEVKGDKAIISNKKTSVEAEVKVETLPAKIYQSTACCLGEDGKYKLQEVRLGGTTMKLLFKDAKEGVAAGH